MSDWREYISSPPDWSKWTVIEWVRSDGRTYFDDLPVHVMNREQFATYAFFNVAGVFWRPVL